MNKERYLQFVASFLIVLVLAFPYYTIGVYATINGVSAKGSDGIEGYIKANDFINFIVNAVIGSTAIKKEQVKLGEIPFGNCVPSASSGYECTLKYESPEQFEGRIPYTISLYDESNVLDDSRSDAVYVDGKAPQVKLSTKQSRFSSRDNIVINYEATDFACNLPDCSGKCVGIKNIDFYTLDGSFKKTEEIASDECKVQSSIIIEPGSLKDGKNSIFAKATDKFSQVSQEKSVTFTLDTAGPEILQNSFSISKNGISLSTFSQNIVAVEAAVNISADDLALNSVTADFSSLNPALKNVKASCSSAGKGLNVCKWPIELNPESAGSKAIMISSLDLSGNYGNATITKQLTLDDKGPVVQSFGIVTSKGTGSLARPAGNLISAVFDEATGLDKDDVLLHINDISLRASRCTKSASWTCVWEDIDLKNGVKLSIDTDTKDILGNSVSESKSLDANVDSKAPQLRNISITAIAGTIDAFPGIFKIGDKLFVVVNVTEENDIEAAADFSKFITDAKNVKGECQKVQADENICVWQTATVNLAANDAILFNFTDSAGNVLNARHSLRTLGLDNGTAPDFWTSSVVCSPSSIDRSIGQLINQRMYCSVSLQQKGAKQASTVFIGPASCSQSSLVQSIETLNRESGSASPVIKITLKKNDFNVNNANLSCSFNIFSKVDNKVTKVPEIENAQINIQFYNLPLGELGDAVQKKIDDAKKDAQGIWKTIEVFNKLVNVAKRICQAISLFYNIVGALYTVAMTLNIVDEGTEKIPFIGLPIKATAIAATCGETSSRVSVQVSYEKTIHKFCAFVNCYNGRFLLDNAPGMDWVREKSKAIEKKIDVSAPGREGTVGFQRPLSEYMNPQSNLLVATLYVPPCLPGIIYGLDKYRQIKCLYADCLQNAVGKDGLPVTACESQKAYATCKYVTGELFAVVPWTAWFDNFVGIIKQALSNPFTAAGVGLSIGCSAVCKIPEGTARKIAWHSCETFRLISQIGLVAQEVTGLAREGFKIRQDYCSRLDFEEEKAAEPAPTQETSKSAPPKAK